ncbi:hypothetical protein PORY_002066 [Pneumocystis oryctolagi]|uniref:Uncharacterized protein n=1 Tax=Pneumocystis oryctolagi TaxID=42067 RepID=A0ACB7CCL4_9ASCO|nr:hypothetical protein PORY_002066 [Pneumocystis oryctolagi]
MYLAGKLVSLNDAFKRLIFSIFMAYIFACVYVVQNYFINDILFLGTVVFSSRQINLFDIVIFVIIPIGIASSMTVLLGLRELWILNHIELEITRF